MKPLFIDIGITDQQLIHFKKIDTPYLTTPFHFHPNCELIYIEEGFGKKVIGDSVSTFHEGTLILLGPDTPHILTNDEIFYRGNKELRSKATVIYFSPAILKHFLKPEALQPLNALISRSSRGLEVVGEAKELISRKLYDIMEQEEMHRLITFLSVLETLVFTTETTFLSSQHYVNTYNRWDMDRINVVYQYLMQHFKHDIELNDVAAIAHLAPTAFCRFFKQRTGKTYSNFLNELRIRHACDLLNNPELTINAISSACGYHNTNNFNRFFKRITGLTPTAWRKKNL